MGEFHPIYACTTGHTFLSMLLLVHASLSYFCAIDRDTGSDLTFQCHQYHGKLRDSMSLPRLSLQPSPLMFTKLSEDLQTTQTSSWDLESKVSLSGATILTAPHLSASRGISSLRDKRETIPFFSWFT